MKLQGFIGPTYTMDARTFDSQRSVNLYPMISETGTSKSVAALRSVPGYVTGYTAGGKVLTPTIAYDNQSNTSYLTFNNVTWSPAVFTARGALIYNSTTGAAVCVLDFGSDKTAANSFTVTFPTADANSAIVRLN